ncbi:MAG: type IV toxin-antitoxin system AbiEi family antitoxin domain-containing protein [Acidimicrobiales bacterium]
MDTMRRLAEQQHGLISREQALANGMNSNQIGARLRRGTWEHVTRNVYRVPGSVPTWEQQMLAAVWAAGHGSAASRESAAALWRIPGFRPGPVEVTQPRGPSSRYPAPGLHDSRFLPPHQIRLVSAIPTTCPERTLLDLSGCVRPGRAERALDNALAMELTTVQRIGLMLAETGARGRPGTALLRRILSVRVDDYVPPASELEALLIAVLQGAGLALPVRQEWVGGTAAPTGRVDFVDRGAKVVIEADSRRYHSAWLDVQADHRRDLLLTAAGYRIIRVNWHQLIKEPELFIAAVKAFRRAAAA